MPVRYYSKIRTLDLRALQIYSILIGCSHRRETLTYKLLANKVGYNGSGVFDRQLELIMHWCSQNALPPLTVLVVNEKTGIPGPGLTSTQDFHADRERVFKFDWYDLVPPTVEEINQYMHLIRK